MSNELPEGMSKMHAVRRRQRGVTLLELLSVIVIIGVLASVAVPTYRQYLIRTQRSEAKIALLQLQTAQEKFYMQNNSFTDNIAEASPDGLGLAESTETGKYTLSVELDDDDGQTYTATATPRTGGGQTDDDDCESFTINQRGTKGVTGPSGAQTCWR
jgi:type IV pilus assembly protein PilE